MRDNIRTYGGRGKQRDEGSPGQDGQEPEDGTPSDAPPNNTD